MLKKVDQDDDEPPWQRYRAQEISCPICGNKFVPKPPNAKTCGSPECKREYERRYARANYDANSAKIIAQTSASRRRRHKPIFKRCIAPAPPDSGGELNADPKQAKLALKEYGRVIQLCGKEFEVKTVGDGRRLTCSKDCSVRRRWALQRKRYHANPQAKRDYKNAYYATNYAQPVGTARCPNPTCGREYLKKKVNQHTCGRPVCHIWKYGITHREEINARKRKKRRANAPADAAYQRDYRKKRENQGRPIRKKKQPPKK
jgi:hypothetical protein